MRVIIDNSRARIYARTSDGLVERTRLATAVNSGAPTFTVLDATGISTSLYLVIGEIGTDKAQKVRVTDVTESTVTVTPALTRAHDNKEPVAVIDYDIVNFYEGSTLIGSAAVTPDYHISIPYTVSSSLTYGCRYYSTNTASMTVLESINGYDALLCSAEDMRLYDKSIYDYGVDLISKMELARDDIRRMFLQQDWDISDLENPEELRYPAALLSCLYVYQEMVKTKDDWASLRMNQAERDYKAKIEAVLDSMEDTQGEVFGQTICER